jgi:hypothetical protein
MLEIDHRHRCLSGLENFRTSIHVYACPCSCDTAQAHNSLHMAVAVVRKSEFSCRRGVGGSKLNVTRVRSRAYHRRWKLEEVQRDCDSESDDDEDLTDQEILEVCNSVLSGVFVCERVRDRECLHGIENTHAKTMPSMRNAHVVLFDIIFF